MDKGIIGLVWWKGQQKAVIGFETESKGYFQFYEIGTRKHFRKAPDVNDEIAEIPYRLAFNLHLSNYGLDCQLSRANRNEEVYRGATNQC